jgi:hypothetical protein
LPLKNSTAVLSRHVCPCPFCVRIELLICCLYGPGTIIADDDDGHTSDGVFSEPEPHRCPTHTARRSASKNPSMIMIPIGFSKTHSKPKQKSHRRLVSETRRRWRTPGRRGSAAVKCVSLAFLCPCHPTLRTRSAVESYRCLTCRVDLYVGRYFVDACNNALCGSFVAVRVQTKWFR